MAYGRKTGGRTKGTPNRTTATVKQALTEAFDQMGGVASLAAWGREHPGEFYSLWAKLLPKELKADVAVDATAGLADALAMARRRAALLPSDGGATGVASGV